MKRGGRIIGLWGQSATGSRGGGLVALASEEPGKQGPATETPEAEQFCLSHDSQLCLQFLRILKFHALLGRQDSRMGHQVRPTVESFIIFHSEE